MSGRRTTTRSTAHGHARRRVLRLALDRPDKRNAINDTDVRRPGRRGRPRRARRSGPGHPHQRGRRPLLRRRRHRGPQRQAGRRLGAGPAPGRQHPAPGPVHRPPPHHPAGRGADAGGVRRCGAGPPASGSRSRWPPTSPSRPTTPRFWEPFTERGFTPDSGATWLLPRRIGDVPGPRAAAASAACSPAPRPPSGGCPPGRPRRRARRHRAEALVTTAGRRARPSPRVSPSGCCTPRTTRPTRTSERGPRPRALVAQRRLPEGLKAFGEKRSPEFGGR